MELCKNATIAIPSVYISTLWWGPSDTLDLDHFDLLAFILRIPKLFAFFSAIAQISSPPNSSTFTKISAAIYILIIHTLSSPPAGSTWRCLNGTDQCLRLHTVCVASLLLEVARLPNTSFHPSSCPLAFGTTDICSSWSCRSALRDQLKHAKLSISSLLRYTHAVMVLAMLAKTFSSW